MTSCSPSADPLGVTDPQLKTTALFPFSAASDQRHLCRTDISDFYIRVYNQSRNASEYLLIAADPPFDALQLGVTDLSELELWHGNDSVALGDELAAVTYEEAVVTRKRLQDLQRQEPAIRMDS